MILRFTRGPAPLSLRTTSMRTGSSHGIFVGGGARRGGVARALLVAMRDALRELGAERIMLTTAVQNEAAQRLFASIGFYPTMIEMSLGESK